MAQEDLTLRQIISRCSNKAIPARKFVKLVEGWILRKELVAQVAQDELATSILLQLATTPAPPAILLNYLGLLLTSSVISTTTLITHILFFVSDDSRTFSQSLLASISTLILSTLPLEQLTVPSTLNKPSTLISLPDIGSSTSPSTVNTVSTLGLLLPLLRQCSIPSPAPGPVVMLVSRILSLLNPYPAPPLDIGLEAGGLFQSLPEAISVPLRNCLSGLMADLAVSQGAPQFQITDTLPPQPAVLPVVGKDRAQTEGRAPVLSLPLFATQMPLKYALDFQVAWAIQADRWTPSDATVQTPPDNHLSLIRLGPLIASNPSHFLQQLIISSLVGTADISADERAQRWLFLTERLPVLLKWWKDQDSVDWPFPNNLPDALSAAFQSEKEGLSICDSWISSTLSTLVQGVETEDESGGWTQPEGWMLCSQKVTLVLRLMNLSLLTRAETTTILPGMTIPSTDPGESLVNRIASSPKSHLKALGHIVAYAPGAARSLAVEMFGCVQTCPQAQPQEGLFVNLADSSTLLSCLGGCINPASWLEIVRSQLLEHPDDSTSRTEDPQGSETRFGDGVVLAEALISHFKLPLPSLLRDARKSVSLADLKPSQRSCVNGWIKALFGSEGIDDEIILATSPADFYRIAPGIIQQAVLAKAAGQIDLETLHSGLSYFAQPLLSWSLGGICHWLIAEVRRNGLVSAPYLDVLQTLVLSPSFPDSTLRLVGSRLTDLLQPGSGLESVFKTSGFDVEGMSQKLTLAGIGPTSKMAVSASLQQTLQTSRTLDIAGPAWASALLNSLEMSANFDGIQATISSITSELLNNQPTVVQADMFPYLIALVIAQRISPIHKSPASKLFIASALSGLFRSISSPLAQPASASQAISIIARTVKSSLVVLSHLNPAIGDVQAVAVLDELSYQRQRPVKRDKTSPQGKRRRVDAISKEAKAALDALVQAWGGDEELKSKWERFGDLATDNRA